MMEEQKKTYKEESEKVVEMKNVNIQSKLKVNVFLIVTDNLLYSLCKQRNSVHSHRHTKNKNCLVSRARSISLSLSLLVMHSYNTHLEYLRNHVYGNDRKHHWVII